MLGITYTEARWHTRGMEYTASRKARTEQAEQLGAALARLRKRAGLSQADAAERLGVEQPTWQRYERATNKALLDVTLQKRCAEALGFDMDDFSAELEAVEQGEAFVPASPRALESRRDALVFPLDGTVRGGVLSAAVYDDDPQSYDLSNSLNRNTRLLRVVGESVVPLAEPGSLVAYDTRGYPKRGHLAVVRLHDGQYLIKKFVRMSDTVLHAIEMETIQLPDGRLAYAEKPLEFDLKLIKGVYPASIRID